MCGISGFIFMFRINNSLRSIFFWWNIFFGMIVVVFGLVLWFLSILNLFFLFGFFVGFWMIFCILG